MFQHSSSTLTTVDEKVIYWSQKAFVPFARISLFVVYFWFGILKIVAFSAANPLVADLQAKTLPFLSFEQFIVGFSLFEMLIGVLFLFSRTQRIATVLFVLHIITTVMPMVLLPEVAWQSPFVPTLEGQYMIKNLVLIALVMGLTARLTPLRARLYS